MHHASRFTTFSNGSADVHTTLLTFLAIFAGLLSVALALRFQGNPKRSTVTTNRRRSSAFPSSTHSPRPLSSRSRSSSFNQSPIPPASPNIKSRSFVDTLKTCFDDDMDSNLLLDGYAMSEYILQAGAGRGSIGGHKPPSSMYLSPPRRPSSKQASARNSVDVAAPALRDSVASQDSTSCPIPVGMASQVAVCPPQSSLSIHCEIDTRRPALPTMKSWPSTSVPMSKCQDATMYL